MNSSKFFLRTIYAVGAIQLAAIFLAWFGVSGLQAADSITLFLADWTAFTLMAHRHAKLFPPAPSRLSQILGVLCLILGVVRLFTVGSGDSVAIILGSYLCLGGTYLLFTRLRDIPSCWPEILVAAVVLLPTILVSQLAIPFYLGGTSVLIVVSVTMDTINQIQSHLLAHQYEGLIEKSQLRGKKRSGSAPKAPARR